MAEKNNTAYKAWDLPTRLFHWINFLCVILLSILGLIMLNKGSIGISGREASIGLKALHVSIGYAFAANLIVRILWGFFSDRYSQWRNLVPGKGFGKALSAYRTSLKKGEPQTFVGHNPIGRLAILVMMLLLTLLMVTGMVRAGTDIYYPPLGNYFANYVSAEGVSPRDIKPYDKTGTDPEKLAEISAFKKPWGQVHIYGAYVLWFLVLIHIIAVVRAEVRGEGTLVSAMFSGKKHLPKPPEDL